MPANTLRPILNLCLKLEKIAVATYARLSRSGGNRELQRFWRQMSDEEKVHVEFWKRLLDLSKVCALPPVFDNPGRVRRDLERVARNVKALIDRWEASERVGDAFVLAYRMEFYMLHPALAVLFHALKTSPHEASPEDLYESHIERFSAMLSRYGRATPELELLGETLRDLWKENRALAEQAMTDSLTGLLNRRGFFLATRQMSFLAQRNREQVGLLMIDIDNFKAFNDALGHPAGDKTLKTVADVLKTTLRKSDAVGRYGGEEFIVFIPSAKRNSLLHVAEKIRKGVKRVGPRGTPLTVSIGATLGRIRSGGDKDLFALIDRADGLLYAAKNRGRNQVIYGGADTSPAPGASTR